MPSRQDLPLYHREGDAVLYWLAHTDLVDAEMADGEPFAIDATPRKRPPPNDLDPDPTPRQLRAGRSLSSVDSFGGVSSSRGSRNSSPRKREVALRATTEYPVLRQPIDGSSPPPLPQPLLDLLRDLVEIQGGRQPVIPHMYKGSLPHGWLDDPNKNDKLFLAPPSSVNDEHVFSLRLRHTRLHEVCMQSQVCEARLEHEAGWNELVHSPILTDALRDSLYLHFRNITACRVRPMFRDPDPLVGESKIDYGIFLNKSALDSYKLIRALPASATHFALSDDAPTPLAISIETKSAAADRLTGSTQLASWVRAHLRQLDFARCALLSAKDANRTRDVNGSPVGDLLGSDEAQDLPTLPLIFAFGSEWHLQVACRRDQKTIIYDRIPIGRTDTLQGCYQLSASIARLGRWAETEFRTWWTNLLQDSVGVR